MVFVWQESKGFDGSTWWLSIVNLGFPEIARGSLVEIYRAMKVIQV